MDRHHHLFGSRLPEPDTRKEARARKRMKQEPCRLDAGTQPVVLKSLEEVCIHKGWTLLAAHVRTNYVHVVVEADQPPELAINTFKACASRALNRLSSGSVDRRRWAGHGSTLDTRPGHRRGVLRAGAADPSQP